MPRGKKAHRGVRVTDLNVGSGPDEESPAMGPSHMGGGAHHFLAASGSHRGPPVARSATDARYQHRAQPQRFPPRPVDAATLRRAFMLQKFQFILRRDLLSLNVGSSSTQGQRKLMECVQSSDVLVPWTAVHSVVVRTTMSEFECPICLERPVAPRITDCGHTFCLPCILHYLHEQKSSDHQRTCPVCDSIIGAHALRPCVLHCVEPITKGQEARFDLFRREQGSCILRRYDDPRRAGTTPPAADTFRERLHLPQYLDSWGSQSRYVFSTEDWEALQRLRDGSDLSEQLTEIESMARPLPQYYGLHERFLLEGLNEVTRDNKTLSHTLTRESPPLVAQNRTDRGDNKVYELYADGEGRPYFLHMLTARMLKHDAEVRGVPLPDSICGLVEEVTSFVQDEESRHVYKVFAHVPLHSTVHLCILNLEGVVSPDTLAAFRPQLQERAQRRRTKEDAEARNAGKDRSWEEYLEKYRANNIGGSGASPLVNSEFSYDRDSMPMLQLPSADSGASEEDRGLLPNPLETRQRATKRHYQDPSASILVGADVAGPSTLTAEQLPTTGGTPHRGPASTNSRWTAGSASKLFKDRPSDHGVAPSWGGHAFEPKEGGVSAEQALPKVEDELRQTRRLVLRHRHESEGLRQQLKAAALREHLLSRRLEDAYKEVATAKAEVGRAKAAQTAPRNDSDEAQLRAALAAREDERQTLQIRLVELEGRLKAYEDVWSHGACGAETHADPSAAVSSCLPLPHVLCECWSDVEYLVKVVNAVDHCQHVPHRDTAAPSPLTAALSSQCTRCLADCEARCAQAAARGNSESESEMRRRGHGLSTEEIALAIREALQYCVSAAVRCAAWRQLQLAQDSSPLHTGSASPPAEPLPAQSVRQPEGDVAGPPCYAELDGSVNEVSAVDAAPRTDSPYRAQPRTSKIEAADTFTTPPPRTRHAHRPHTTAEDCQVQ